MGRALAADGWHAVTAVRTVTLSCEHDGCDSTLTIILPSMSVEAPFQRTVRQRAHDAGWKFQEGNDLCPTHKPPRMPTRYVDCPREGCGRNIAVNQDGSLRRHRRIVDGELGPSCRDPVTGENRTRYPNFLEGHHD